MSHQTKVLALKQAAQRINFDASSTDETGRLLSALAASKPHGQLLELGTGAGIGTAWLADGLAPQSTLTSVDNEEAIQKFARDCLCDDPRIRFVCADAGSVIENWKQETLDLIFADAWPGKFSHLDETLSLLKPGGLYVIDDLLPQTNWPEGHQHSVDDLKKKLKGRDDLRCSFLDWSSGIMIGTKV